MWIWTHLFICWLLTTKSNLFRRWLTIGCYRWRHCSSSITTITCCTSIGFQCSIGIQINKRGYIVILFRWWCCGRIFIQPIWIENFLDWPLIIRIDDYSLLLLFIRPLINICDDKIKRYIKKEATKIKECNRTFFMLATITIIVTCRLIGFYDWCDLIGMMMMLAIDICTYERKKERKKWCSSFIDLFCSMSSAVYKKTRS